MNRKQSILVISMLCIFSIIPILNSINAESVSSTGDWPMFLHDEAHTGYSASDGPETDNVIWSYSTGGGIKSSPVVANGRVYIGSNDDKVYCLDANLSDGVDEGIVDPAGANYDRIWEYFIGIDITSTPTIFEDEIYVTTKGNIYCLNSDGTLKWSNTTSSSIGGDATYWPSPTVSDRGIANKVFSATKDGGIYCFNANNGDLDWSYDLEESDVTVSLESSPSIVDEKLFIASHLWDASIDTPYGKVYCIDIDTASLLWEFSESGAWVNRFHTTPTVLDDKVYIGAYGYYNGEILTPHGRVYCLNALTGKEIWNYTITDGTIRSSIAIGNGKLYFGSRDNNVYCLNALDGSLVWDYSTSGYIYSSPALIDDKVYVGSYDTDIYCLKSDDGELIWHYSTGGAIASSPAVVDGLLYVGSYDNKIYCFGDEDISTPELVISTVSSVTEGETFEVTVTADGSPIEDVTVTIDESIYLTDSNGIAKPYAPDVTEDTPFTITASKTGYQSATAQITVIYVQPPLTQLVISAPTSVTEGEVFDVTVTADDSPIESVTVTIDGSTYSTDSNGIASLTAPQVEEDSTFTITASKTDYLNGETTIEVINIMQQLDIEFETSSSVFELRAFSVIVTANGVIIEGAQVAFNGMITITDNEGKVTLAAPQVDETTKYTISASKTGYQPGSTTVTILNEPEQAPDDLVIDVISSVAEEKDFVVTVTAENQPISDVTVMFHNSVSQTNSLGEVTLNAPAVENDVIYKITATKTLYNSDEAWITIINQDGWIQGIVTDSGTSSPITNALICVHVSSDTTLCEFSDSNGEYSIEVSAGTYSIESSKEGYETSIKENIVVENNKITTVDFLMDETEEEQSGSVANRLTRNQIVNQNIVATVDLTGVSIFDNNINIESPSKDINTDEGVQVIISGNGTNGTKIVIFIGEVENPDDIIVIYDNIEIYQTNDIIGFFSEDNSNNEWILTSAGIGNNIVIVNVPEYSTHTINILLKPEAVAQFSLFAIALAFGIILVAAIGMFRTKKEED